MRGQRFHRCVPGRQSHEYEQEMRFMEKEHADVLAAIGEKKEIDSTIEENFTKALGQFRDIYLLRGASGDPTRR